jgi:two-component system chemotaxis response regulator CheY
MRSLIVEDQLTVRTLLRLFLADLGPVREASSGARGLAAFEAALDEEEPFDVVCLDIGLPDKTGLEVLEQLRELEEERGILPGRGATVLIVTGDTDPRRCVAAFRRQADGFLRKPVSRDELLAALQKLAPRSLSPEHP